MYEIGNVILGTYLPWEGNAERDVSLLYATQETIEANGLDCSLEELRADADNGDSDFWLEFKPWHREYHGAAPGAVAWVGVKLAQFDTTDHFSLSDLELDPPAPIQMGKARDAYNSIPENVRAVLPPFGVYVVWSSS